MLIKHEQGRRFTRGMREAAECFEAGEEDACAAVEAKALGYAALLLCF
ncbi:MAG TPA: hypothetical protein VMT46_05890 [Anaerolineaceae bacterium]|nr:hypothetical protein [Anaerolineaceae bacterium]